MMETYQATPAVDGYPDLIVLLEIEMGVPSDIETLNMLRGMARSGVLYRMSPDENWLIEAYEMSKRMGLILNDYDLNPEIFDEDEQ
jgi:hypothetical protein